MKFGPLPVADGVSTTRSGQAGASVEKTQWMIVAVLWPAIAGCGLAILVMTLVITSLA